MPLKKLAQGDWKRSPELLQFSCSPPEPPMTIDRDSLIAEYAQQILDGMDYKTMECFVYDTLKDNLSSYSDEELVCEVKEYNPGLLDG